MADSSTPGKGDIRFNDDGKVEAYDGTQWKPYGELPEGPDYTLRAWEYRIGEEDDELGGDGDQTSGERR